jgi:hypothetical protein
MDRLHVEIELMVRFENIRYIIDIDIDIDIDRDRDINIDIDITTPQHQD